MEARDSTRATSRTLLTFGLKNAAVAVMGAAISQSGLLVVGLMLSARHVGAYALAARVTEFARGLATRAADVLVPAFADAAARNDSERQLRLYAEATVFSSTVLHPISIVLVLFGDELLNLWVDAVPEHTSLILALLVIGASFQIAGHVGFVFFNGVGDLRLYLRVGSIAALVCVLLSVALTATYGVVGPAIASLATFVIFDAMIVPAAVARRLGARPLALAGLLARPLIPAALATISVGLLAKHQWGGSNAAALMISPALLTFYAGVWIASAGRDRRQLYVGLVRRAT